MKINREKFSLDAMTEKFDSIMEEYTGHISNPSEVVEFKLPKKTDKLPKLKKVEETV